MKFGRLFGIAALAAASSVFTGAKSSAGTLPDSLANVVTDSPYTIGDKQITFISVVPSGTQPPTLSNVTVTGNPLPANDPSFSLNGSIVSALGAGATSDLALSYQVTSLGGGITAVSLSGTGSFTASSIGSITEQVHTGSISGPTVGTGTIFGTNSTVITLSGGPYTTLYITKNINVTNGSTNDNPTFGNYSIVTQDFNQTTVPEPASFVMMGMGVGLGGLVLRRRMAVKV
jgi:hypothetical protein